MQLRTGSYIEAPLVGCFHFELQCIHTHLAGCYIYGSSCFYHQSIVLTMGVFVLQISTGGSSIVMEFGEIYPSVLCFPFEPNKPIRSSISLVNKSEHTFCFIIILATPEDKEYIDIDVDQDYMWPHSTCSVHVTMKNEDPPPHLDDIQILLMKCGSSEFTPKAMSHFVGKHPQLIKRIRDGGGWACEVSLMAVICNPDPTIEATKKEEVILPFKSSLVC